MAGDDIKRAIALAGGVFLTLTHREREDVLWYQYTTEITPIHDAGDVPRLYADGGTSIECLQPYLDSSEPHDRWLIITDGEIPDLDSITGKLALICIGSTTPSDPRCIGWPDDIDDNRTLLERQCRRIQQLLR